MIADFATQLVDPPRVRCIGVEMKPFSLGHWLILKNRGSSFVHLETPIFGDLFFAVIVCSQTFEKANQLLSSPLRLKMAIWFLQKLCQVNGFNLADESWKLSAFIKAASQIPEPKKKKGAGVRSLASDWDTRLYRQMRIVGMGHSESLNMPLSICNLIFVSHLEEEGALEFKTRQDFEHESRATSIVEAMERGEAA